MVQEIGFSSNDLFKFCLILCFICFCLLFWISGYYLPYKHLMPVWHSPEPWFTVLYLPLSHSFLLFYWCSTSSGSLHWCLFAFLFLHSQTGSLKVVQHKVKAKHLKNTGTGTGQSIGVQLKGCWDSGLAAWSVCQGETMKSKEESCVRME